MTAYLQRVANDFSRASAGYDQHAHLQRQVTQALATHAAPQMISGTHWLDAGCGTGALARLLGASPAIILTQLDLAFGMCQQAYGQSSLTVCADLRHLPFASAQFDGIFSSLALQWATPIDQAMLELRRVTQSGGMLALSTLLPGTLRELEGAFYAAAEPSRLHRFHPLAEWQASLLASGWRIQHASLMPITLPFGSVQDVLRHLQGLGATRKTGLQPLSPNALKRIIAHYPLTETGQVSAHFEVWIALALAV